MTGFSRKQAAALGDDLDPAHVRTRTGQGRKLNYIEGWFAIAEANAVFGFDGWDREVLQFEKLYERRQHDGTNCGYLARVRIRVRAEGIAVLREGTGFGGP